MATRLIKRFGADRSHPMLCLLSDAPDLSWKKYEDIDREVKHPDYEQGGRPITCNTIEWEVWEVGFPLSAAGGIIYDFCSHEILAFYDFGRKVEAFIMPRNPYGHLEDGVYYSSFKITGITHGLEAFTGGDSIRVTKELG